MAHVTRSLLVLGLRPGDSRRRVSVIMTGVLITEPGRGDRADYVP